MISRKVYEKKISELPLGFIKIFSGTLEYRINGRVRIIGGLEMARYNNNRGVGIIGGGVLVEIENSLFLSENVSSIFKIYTMPLSKCAD